MTHYVDIGIDNNIDVKFLITVFRYGINLTNFYV